MCPLASPSLGDLLGMRGLGIWGGSGASCPLAAFPKMLGGEL